MATGGCRHTFPDGTRCRLVDHSAPGLAEVHTKTESPGPALVEVLLKLLLDEYGGTPEDWTAQRSLRRIADALTAHSGA